MDAQLQAADPVALGFDPDRLTRVDDTLGRYVDDGRLAGWSLLVSRHGEIAHVAYRGLRDVEAQAPVEPDTIWRNRHEFMKGRDEVVAFLTKKWAHEDGYRLRKELFAFTDNKIAVQVRSLSPFPPLPILCLLLTRDLLCPAVLVRVV